MRFRGSFAAWNPPGGEGCRPAAYSAHARALSRLAFAKGRSLTALEGHCGAESLFGVLGRYWKSTATISNSRHAVGFERPVGSRPMAGPDEDDVVCGCRAPRFRDRLLACGLARQARAAAERRALAASRALRATGESAGRPSLGCGGWEQAQRAVWRAPVQRGHSRCRPGRSRPRLRGPLLLSIQGLSVLFLGCSGTTSGSRLCGL